MAISDLFSTSFLFSVVIIIVLMCGIFAYVSYRMSEQDHKLTSMVNLVSILAQDLRSIRSKLAFVETDLHSNKLQYPSDMMGGKDSNELISVSDDESEDDDETQDDDEPEYDDEPEDEGVIYSSDEEDMDNTQEQIKLLNLTLANEDIDNFEDIINDFEELETLDKDAIKTIHIETSIVFDEPENSNCLDSDEKNTNMVNENTDLDINTSFDFKNITISDLEEVNDTQTFKTDYKKMSLNKLREVVVSKGVVADASKLKKNEILKMLGEE